MTVLQVCAYAAPTEGNFMKSLYCLENKLKEKKISTIYAFPESAKNIDWCIQLCRRVKVYFLPLAKARIKPSTYIAFQRIYSENPDIDIVHSHFELYDIPATVMAGSARKVFWHLHDAVVIHDGIRTALWKFQYSVIGKKAVLLSVAESYRKELVALGFPGKQSYAILNGIDLDRLKKSSKRDVIIKYDFLTFGWDFYGKGGDVILEACERLYNEGYRFRFLLNGNTDTFASAEEYLKGKRDYLEYGMPVKDISQLFEQCGCFILASRRETFSYSVCESAYFGMPVISSDIPGLEWAHDLPTVSFFETENVDSLYQEMKTYLDGRVYSVEEYRETKEIIEALYTIEAWADKVIQYYEK